jgi:hypothetical protein
MGAKKGPAGEAGQFRRHQAISRIRRRISPQKGRFMASAAKLPRLSTTE